MCSCMRKIFNPDDMRSQIVTANRTNDTRLKENPILSSVSLNALEFIITMCFHLLWLACNSSNSGVGITTPLQNQEPIIVCTLMLDDLRQFQ